MKTAERVGRLPPYIFADLERLEEEKRREGVDVISLGIGDPDLPPPGFVTEALTDALKDVGFHQYSSSQGEKFFRDAVAEWYGKRFGVSIDPDREVCALIGSKEGLANVARAFVDRGDRVGVPDPGYPVYAQGAALLCDGIPVTIQLNDSFLPEFPFPEKLAAVFLNYPNNPTAAFAGLEDIDSFVEAARDGGSLLCYDNAYSEQYFGDGRPPSVLQTKHSFEGVVEFHSLSKTFNITGFRAGFAVGDETVIAGLKKVKSQIDSGIPKFIQAAGAAALGRYSGAGRPEELEENAAELEKRMRCLVDGLRELGFNAKMPGGTFYLWLPVAGEGTGMVRQMIEAGIVATPGIAFGNAGRNFVRFAVTAPMARIELALQRVGENEQVLQYAGRKRA